MIVGNLNGSVRSLSLTAFKADQLTLAVPVGQILRLDLAEAAKDAVLPHNSSPTQQIHPLNNRLRYEGARSMALTYVTRRIVGAGRGPNRFAAFDRN
jgi:hypothetical protein